MKDTTDNYIAVFVPVTWLCQLKYQIFLNRRLSPTSDSPPPVLIGLSPLQLKKSVSKHNARPREASPLSGEGGVSGLGQASI